MASSGSFNTSSYSSRYLTFSWWINSQDIANNKTNIGWKLVGAGSASGYYVSGNFKVVINGSTVYSSSTRIQLWNGTQVASGNVDISHNSDGTKSFSASAEAGIYYVAVNCSGSGSWTLTSIPRQANLTSAPDFNDEGNPTINYSNPAGNSVSSLQACISWTGAADIAYRDISKTGTSYTFNFTDAERTALRNSITTANSRKVTFYVRTVIGGNTYYSTIEKTLTIVNANPSFSSSKISYKDNNSTTVAVTGNNQHLVQNLSKLLVTISAATGLKGASISKYEATINGVTKSITSAGNIDYGVINSGSNLTLSVKVTDSRGNTTTATKTVTFLAWSLPTALISLKRKNNYENETYLKVDGSISSVNSKNTMTIQYQYKKTTESSYSSLITISDNVQVTMTKDKESAWDFKIIIKDKFGTTTYNAVLPKGRFILFIDTKKLSVGINCFPTKEESLEVNGKTLFDITHPIGSIYKSRSSTNPSTYGGTWTLISNTPDRKYVGSQVIHAGASGSGNANKVGLIGSYDYGTIEGVFTGVPLPTGYHREYRITFQGYTGNDAQIKIHLNNIVTNGICTWSGNQFRIIGASAFFKQSDITLETTLGYSRNGTNLYYSVTGTSTNWQFWDVVVHGYLASDENEYVWKRTG